MSATLVAPRTGRRKEAVARVILRPGGGGCKVNGRPIQEYFRRDSLTRQAQHPLLLTNSAQRYEVDARIMGGGQSGQAGALRLAIARALARQDETLRAQLRRSGQLTRDPRMKERKKYGQPGARKRFQFSKR